MKASNGVVARAMPPLPKNSMSEDVCHKISSKNTKKELSLKIHYFGVFRGKILLNSLVGNLQLLDDKFQLSARPSFYTPFTRSSKHQANIKQLSSKCIQK